MKNPTIDRLNQSKDEIIEKYKNGLGSHRLGNMYSCDSKTILRFLRANNIEITKFKMGECLYTVNHQFFNQIDNEDKAYIFGFWMSDGCLRLNRKQKNIKLVQHKKDKSILDNIKNKLEYTGPILYAPTTYFYKNHKYINPIYELCITNSQLFDDLNNKGCTQRKSLTLKFPDSNIIPNHLMFAFIRGFYDGNGSLYCDSKNNHYTIQIDASSFFITELSKFLNQHLHIMTHTSTYKQGKYTRLRISKKDNIKTFFDWTYYTIPNLNNLYIERKYQKYQQFLLHKFNTPK